MKDRCCRCGVVSPAKSTTLNGWPLCAACVEEINGGKKEMMTTCPDCGKKMDAAELIRHRPKGNCIAKLRALPPLRNKAIGGGELANREGGK